jgi:hypothetical protein
MKDVTKKESEQLELSRKLLNIQRITRLINAPFQLAPKHTDVLQAKLNELIKSL